MRIFLDEGDYQKFLYILSDVVDEFDLECWDYCVMPNHYHLALLNRQENLSEAMQQLNGEYAVWWNGTHRRVGHTFQGRFKDQIVQQEGYLATLVRYIALNPVRAKLVKRPADWKWSGHRCLAGLNPSPSFLTPDAILREFDGDLVVARERYVKHVVTSSAEEDARADRLRSKERVIGDRLFKRSILGGARGQRDERPPILSPATFDAVRGPVDGGDTVAIE